MQAFDALDRLGQISCPVLILAGEDDSVAPPRFARQLHERLPRADLLILPGVGHAPPIEDAGQFNAQLARFFSFPRSAWERSAGTLRVPNGATDDR
jgi:proline iminopeptidase